MKKINLLLVTIFFFVTQAFSQARMILNDNAFLVIDNAAFVVVDNPNANALTTAGAGGNIVSENEFDRIKWNIGASTGSYTVPFSKSSGYKIPLTLNIAAPGSGSGNVTFSTYPGPTWNNDTYRPSDVTHMLDNATGSVNNSAYVIDRFWIIDALGYASKPSVDILFQYEDPEWTAVGNTITEPNFFAQRFNNSINHWGDWFGLLGTCNTVANTAASGPVSAADFYRSWTLVDVFSPLPVDLVSFNASADNKDQVNCLWTTASETNASYFQVEKSLDGISFLSIGTVPAHGNSTTLNQYEWNDKEPYKGISYYRLKQIDFSGKINFSKQVPVYLNNASAFDFSVFPNPVSEKLCLVMNHSTEGEFNLQIGDQWGRVLLSKAIFNTSGRIIIPLKEIPDGIYFCKVGNMAGSSTQKFVVRH